MALRRSDGSVIWDKTARTERPHEGTHQTGSFAANSAVTDGETLFAYFGSRGLYAYDFDGNLKWERDFGDMTIRYSFGEGSSPALHGDTLVLIWDNEKESFIVAVDKRTGKEIWRKTREEQTSWTTPLILEVGGRAQVITSATGQVRSYDLATGDQVWNTGGMTFNAIPSPVYADGIVYLMSGFRGNAIKAIRLADAKGDVTGTSAVVWEYAQDTPYVPSPLLYDGILYFLKSNNGILSAFDAKTGKPHYSLAAPGAAHQHLLVAGGRRRQGLHHRSARLHDRGRGGADLQGGGDQQARRRVRLVGGGGRRRDLPAREEPVLPGRGQVGGVLAKAEWCRRAYRPVCCRTHSTCASRYSRAKSGGGKPNGRRHSTMLCVAPG